MQPFINGGGRNIVSITRSAFYDNKTIGVWVGSGSKTTIENSSIFGNTGDGIYGNAQSAQVTLRHVTVTANGGYGFHSDGGPTNGIVLMARNSIIYGNTGKDCRLGFDNTDVSHRGSIIGTGTARCLENSSSRNPLLSRSTTGPYYQLTSGSPAINAVSCIPGISVDQRGVSRGCRCDIGAFEFDLTPCPPPVLGVLAATCETLPANIVVSNRHAETACQQVGGAGIGVTALVAGGAREAVDVWNAVGPGTKVCFAAPGGSIQFLDAAHSPRRPEPLMAFSEGGRVCATIDRPGTVVLMPGPAPPAAVAAVARPVMADEGQQELQNCMVRTTHILSLRAEPWGEVKLFVPYDALLTAFSRRDGWYEVDYHGARGWLSADYVVPQGDCG